MLRLLRTGATLARSIAPSKLPNSTGATSTVQVRHFWWKDDEDDTTNSKKPPTTAKTKEEKKTTPRTNRAPLHIMGDSEFSKDNVIDIDSTETTHSSSTTTSNDDDDDDNDDDDDTPSLANDKDNTTSPAVVGEGEHAPHVPSVMIIPRRGTPVFPVPELHQHIFIKNPEVVKQLEKQLSTGTPYIGVFLRKKESVVDTSQPESEENTYDVDDVIHDLDEVYSTGTLAQVASIRQVPQFNNVEQEDADTTHGNSPPRTWYVMLTGHRRIRFNRADPEKTVLESGPPMVINIEHLSTPEYDTEDAKLTATARVVFDTIRDVSVCLPHCCVLSANEDPTKLCLFLSLSLSLSLLL